MAENFILKYKNTIIGKQKSKIQFVIFIILAIIVWFIIGIIFSGKKIETVKQPSIVNVDVATLEQKNIVSNILIYGQTKASEKVTLKARTSGTVKKIYKHKGEYVKKGDIIFNLHMEDRIAKFNAAKAAKEKARIEFNTAKSLLAQNLISKMNFIASEAAFKNANANLDRVKLDMDYTFIKAPFNGIVNDLFIEEGGYVSNMVRDNDVGIFVNLNPIKITAEIPEKYINKISKGVIANITLSNGIKVDGLLSYVASVANINTRTFSIELQANNQDKKLVEGMTAEINLPLDTIAATKLNVSSCLTFGDDGSIGVKTIDNENKVHFYPVEIVKEEDNGLWVSGLPKTTNVIVAGGEFVKIGEIVNPKFIK